MKRLYMLDTDISSYLINGRASEHLKAMVKKNCSHLCISAITFAELSYGAARKNSERLNEAVSLFQQLIGQIIPWSENAAMHYAEIRCAMESAGTTIGHMDIMIAASALAEGAELVTNNVKHFSMVPGLKIQNWQTPD